MPQRTCDQDCGLFEATKMGVAIFLYSCYPGRHLVDNQENGAGLGNGALVNEGRPATSDITQASHLKLERNNDRIELKRRCVKRPSGVDPARSKE